jgi:phytoene synthase
MKALMPHVPDYGIQASHLNAVIEGCQMDLEQTRFLDYAGLAALLPSGGRHRRRGRGQHLRPQQRVDRQYAHKLGLAMQLTNIIRDVGDDARRGRIYLPVSELQRFDVKANEILARTHRTATASVHRADEVPGRACHRCYDEALALLPEADRVAQKPGLMMANIYRTLLREIEADNFQVLHQRTSLTPLRKLWIALRTELEGTLIVKREVAVIGGGWAGLAAAIEAITLGHQVTLFEMAPQLGGRADA